jgi:hypothetical protein
VKMSRCDGALLARVGSKWKLSWTRTRRRVGTGQRGDD